MTASIANKEATMASTKKLASAKSTKKTAQPAKKSEVKEKIVDPMQISLVVPAAWISLFPKRMRGSYIRAAILAKLKKDKLVAAFVS